MGCSLSVWSFWQSLKYICPATQQGCFQNSRAHGGPPHGHGSGGYEPMNSDKPCSAYSKNKKALSSKATSVFEEYLTPWGSGSPGHLTGSTSHWKAPLDVAQASPHTRVHSTRTFLSCPRAWHHFLPLLNGSTWLFI